MVSAEIWISFTSAVLTAGLFGYVGVVVGRRPTAPEARLARTAFSVWWHALAGTTLLGGLTVLVFAAGYGSVALFLAIQQVSLLAIVIALWGLIYYLLYLFTGRHGLWKPLTAFYVGYWLTLLYYVQLSDPYGYDVGSWSVQAKNHYQVVGPLYALLLVLLVVPQILGAVAYFTLYFRATDRTQKYRIALVSWSIIVWFGSSLVVASFGREASMSSAWQVTSRLIGILAGLAVLAAYKPPRIVRRWLGVHAVDEPAPERLPEVAEMPRERPLPSGLLKPFQVLDQPLV